MVDNVSNNLNTTNLPVLDYTGIDKAAEEKITAGQFGNVQNITVVDDGFMLTTDLGTIHLGLPQLPPPEELEDNVFLDADADLSTISTSNAVTDMSEIMVLFHQLAMEQRQMGREARRAERENVVASIEQQADLMREAAMQAMIAGVVTGAFQIAGGLTSVAGGAAGLKAMKGVNPANQGAMGMASSKAQNYGQIATGSGQSMQGTGQIISSLINYQAEMTRADQKEEEANQTQHEANVQNENEFVQAFTDNMREVRQKLQELIQSQNEIMKTAIRV